MRVTTNRRRLALTVAVSMAAVTAAACGSDDDGEAGGGTDLDCSAFESYGDLEGTEVSVYAPIVDQEGAEHEESYIPFEECTGVDVVYEGSREFEAQLLVRLESGSPPDVAIVPQPGLIQTMASDYSDVIQPVGEDAESNVDDYYAEEWKGYGSVDGTFYGAPYGANVKSFVWYSPSAFNDAGYEIPETWDEMMSLSQEIADTGAKPWCAGIESGDATGWPATDWLEDVLLRTAGPEVYDQWVNHEIPFDDPQVVEALDTAGAILKDEAMVNGGLGGVQSIATTSHADAGLPILDGNCWMHRQASFFQANWPEGTDISEEGDVFAFYLPSVDGEERPILGAGEFSVAFAERPEVQAFQAYVTSPEWTNEKASVTSAGWATANTELDVENLKSPIDQLSYELLADEEATFRFDGSDLMPGNIGAGTLWTALVDWIALGESSEDVLAEVEAAWTD